MLRGYGMLAGGRLSVGLVIAFIALFTVLVYPQEGRGGVTNTTPLCKRDTHTLHTHEAQNEPASQKPLQILFQCFIILRVAHFQPRVGDAVALQNGERRDRCHELRGLYAKW